MDDINKLVEYAPIIIVLFMFFLQYKIFVTPANMTKEFMAFEGHLEEKFVQKETYNVAITEIKNDIAEMKEKLDKIYEKLTQG